MKQIGPDPGERFCDILVFMKNIQLRRHPNASTFRKIAAVAWDAPRDPTIYGTVNVPADALVAWIAKKREETGEKITVTHAVARGVALVLRRHPELNAMVRWGRIWVREDVDVFLQVAVESEEAGAADLSGVMIRRADTKDLVAISQELRGGAKRIRAGEDAEFQRTKSQIDLLPPLLYRVMLRLIEFCQYELNLNLSSLGVPRDPFGSAMVTSLGMKGVEMAYAPFFPQARAPMLILVGILGFVASFAMSLGPVMWVLLSEIFPNRVRGVAISLVTAVNSGVSALVQFFFPLQLESMGVAGVFAAYALFAAIGLALMAWLMPETKGKSLEELEDELASKSIA